MSQLKNLDNGLQPLREWLTKPTITIILVTGNGPGAQQMKTRIQEILEAADDQYPDVRFGTAAGSFVIAPAMNDAGLPGYEGYTLLSISPDPKKIKTKKKDEQVVNKPGSILQAINQAQAD